MTLALSLLSTAIARAEEEPVGQSAPGAAPAEPVNVVVHGTRREARTSRRVPTGASTVLSGEELRAPGTSTADALSRAPGVQVSRTGSSAELATASLRGATSAETPVYLAGVRLNDELSGTADLSTVPLWMIERIEVFRGNAPGEADRLGPAGAIWLKPRLPSRSRVGGGAEVGSFGARSVWAAGAVASPGSAALVAVRRDGADNDYTYLDDNGTRADPSDDAERPRRNADFASTDVWSVGRHGLGDGARMTTVVNVFQREQGSPGLLVINARAARTKVRRLLGAVSARVPCGHADTGEEACHLELATSALVAHSTITDPLRELTPAALTESAGERVQQSIRFAHALGDAGRIGAGAEQAFERLAVDTSSGALRARRATTRPTVTAEWLPASDITLHALAAVECHSTEGPSEDSTCGTLEPSGRLGAAYEASKGVELRANVGRNVRVPMLGELYGLSAVVVGNPDLVPEKSLGGDVGVLFEHHSGSRRQLELAFESFAFARYADDLIVFVQTARTVTPFNVGRARVLGVEASGALDWARAVRLEAAATLLDPRDTSPNQAGDNDILPFRSRLVLSSFAELYAEPEFAALARASIGVRLTHRSSRFADRAGLIVIGAQTVGDVEGSLSWLEGRLGARIAVRNVTGATQFDAVGLPLPGRAFYASAEAWWW